MTYLSIFIMLLLILFLLLTITSKNIKDGYANSFNKIFDLYGYTLVELDKKIDLKSKKIVKAKNFNDLINASYGKKKPIYYYMSNNSCEFILKNNEEIYIYVLKK